MLQSPWSAGVGDRWNPKSLNLPWFKRSTNRRVTQTKPCSDSTSHVERCSIRQYAFYKYLIHCWTQVEVFGFILLDRIRKNCKSSKWLFKWRFRTDKVPVVKVHGKYSKLLIQMIWRGRAELAKKGSGFIFRLFSSNVSSIDFARFSRFFETLKMPNHPETYKMYI